MRLKFRYDQFCLFVFGLTLGSAVCWFCWVDYSRELALEAEGVSATARVTNVRIFERDNRSNFELRYWFSPPGSRTAFSHGDFFGRSDLWNSLPEDAWERARATGQVEVRYLPSDPSVNRPVEGAGGSLGGCLTGLAFGGFFAVLSCVCLVAGFAERAKLLRDPCRADVQRLLYYDPTPGAPEPADFAQTRSMNRGHSLKALGLGWLFIAIGLLFAADFWHGIPYPAWELTHGQVVSVDATDKFLGGFQRPVLTVRIDGSDTEVRAILTLNGPDEIPPHVTFYYSGDPNREVFLREEVNTGYVALGLAVVGLGLLWLSKDLKRRSLPPATCATAPASGRPNSSQEVSHAS